MNLKIDLNYIGSCFQKTTDPSAMIHSLETYYPELVSVLNILKPPLKVLFNDLDGTVTNTAGGENGSAYMLVLPNCIFDCVEKPVEIGPDHPLFEGCFGKLKEFYHYLTSQGVLVVPVTQNFKGVTQNIMQQLTGTPSYGWYASSLEPPSQGKPDQLNSKSEFMTAVCFYIRERLGVDAKFLFVDDNHEEIRYVKECGDIRNIVVSHQARPWLGQNAPLCKEIVRFFEL